VSGAALTLIFSSALIVLGLVAFRRFFERLDPAERLGLAGLLALGFVGWLTFFGGFVPGGYRWGFGIFGVTVAAAIVLVFTNRDSLRKNAEISAIPWVFLGPIAILSLLPLISVLAPSDMMDWDSLAYHLAVPKVWLAAGQFVPLDYDHHSWFPFAIDNLFVWGESWGGQHGAKAFMWVFLLLGFLTVFGFARRLYGNRSGWWAVLAFAGIPLVLWESGTAYIDVANGLFAGLGLAYCAELAAGRPRSIWLPALLLGFAAGSKYTGLQVVVACGVVLLLGAIWQRSTQRTYPVFWIVALPLLALLVASPWYIRNLEMRQNPVYPFLYERLGGTNWDDWRAEVYRNEQQTFGIGRTAKGRDPLAFGSAVLGLAFQPGRFINPMQEAGGGLPLGAIGVAVLCSGVLWMVSGRLTAFEAGVLVGSGVVLVFWFYLSQQSRYILTFAPPLCILAGGAVAKLRLGQLLAGICVLQAAYAGWLTYDTLTRAQLPVVLGRESRTEYLAKRVPFSVMAAQINAQAKNGRVALYDEVFGYFLDVPYFWANPGHSTVIPYEHLNDGSSYAQKMMELGFTHVYLNPHLQSHQQRDRFLSASGLAGSPVPYSQSEREEMFRDLNAKWKLLVAEAIAEGKLVPVAQERSGVLFAFLQ